MNLFNQIIEKIESLLPENITWNEINKYNHLYEFDLKKPIFIAFFLYVMRLLFERLRILISERTVLYPQSEI